MRCLSLLALLFTTSAGAQSYDKNKEPDMFVKPGQYQLDMKDFVFPSGLRVILQEDHSEPIVAITAYVDHGSTSDPIGKEGIAHFVEHLWFRSEHGDLPKTWDVLSSLGCNLNASTGADFTNYMSVCPSESLESLLQLESLRITEPIFNVKEEVVDTEREVVRNELRMRYENTAMMAFPYLFSRLYPEGHPYARLGIGSHGSLDNIRLADIQTFTESYYKPENTTIVIIGDFDASRATNLLFENFDPSLFHPDLTREGIQRFVRPGVTDPDPENPDDWSLWAIDPDTQKPIVLGTPKVRVSGAAPEPPAPADRVTAHVDAAVEVPTAFIAWTLPGAYRGNEGELNVAAGMTSSAMFNYFRKMSPSANSSSDVVKDSVTQMPNVGCFAWPGKLDTKIICSIELTDEDKGEYVIEKALDQLAGIWSDDSVWAGTDPEYQQFIERSFQFQKNGALSSILLSVDLVSSLSGRATKTAEHAHYTGSTSFFSDSMNAIMPLSSAKLRAQSYKYLTRDRAVSIVAHPLSNDKRVKNVSGSDYHGASRDDAIVKTTLSADQISPEYIKKLFTGPDLSKISDFKMDNGMRVVIYPHGEAPLAQATLIWEGADRQDPAYLNDFANDMSSNIWSSGAAEYDPLRIAASWNWTNSGFGTAQMLKGPADNLEGMLWLLRESINERAPDLQYKRSWIRRSYRGARSSWGSRGAWQSDLLISSLLGQNEFLDGEDWEWTQNADENWDKQAVQAYLDKKYHPSHATLLIVGRVDMKQATSLANGYFSDWTGAKDATAQSFGPLIQPSAPKAGKIVLFDKAKSTQTDVKLMCRVEDSTDENWADQTLLGEMVSDEAWKVLREESGVTYGAGAGVRRRPTNASTLTMTSLVQNSGAVLAVQTFESLIEKVENKELSEKKLKQLALKTAMTNVLGQQSTEQASYRLMGPIFSGKEWKTLTGKADQLGSVSLDRLAQTMGDCKSNRVITLVGPLSVLEPALTEAGINYEVFDWEAAGDKIFEKYDPKGYSKHLKKEAKADAKKAKTDAE